MLIPLAMVVEPVFETVKSVEVAVAVDEPIAKSIVAVSPLLVWIANFAKGVDEPIPIEPDIGRAKPVVVAGRVPKSKFPMLSWLFAVVDAKKMLEPKPTLPPPEVRVV